MQMFLAKLNFRTVLFFLSETLLFTFWIIALEFIINGEIVGKIDLRNLIVKVFFAVAILQATLFFNGLYNLNTFGDWIALIYRLAASLFISSLILGAFYWIFPDLKLSPIIWFSSLFIAFLSSLDLRIWTRKMGRADRSSVLIVGTGEMATSIAKEILNNPMLGMNVCGFVGEDRAMVGKSLFNPRVIGTIDDLEPLAARNKIDRILVAVRNRRGHLPVETLLNLKMAGVEIEEGASFFEKTLGKLPVEELNPSYLVFSDGFKVSKWTLFYKRAFSILFSIIGLIVAAPLMLIVAILIKLDSRGPVFFKQERVGKNGRIFNLIKFRSMYVNAEEKTGPVWAHVDDPRITRVGRFIRRARIDELPQFINILKGDMQFIGPRPERPFFVEHLKQVIPYYSQRHRVSPGLTGWAQVKYSYGATIEEAREKLKYDLYYIKNVSILLDLWIVFQTLKIVLLGRGAR